MATTKITKYFGLTGAAEVLGVSKQRVLQLEEAGVLPEPDGIIDGKRRVWEEKSFRTWAAKRRKAVAKAGPGRAPAV